MSNHTAYNGKEVQDGGSPPGRAQSIHSPLGTVSPRQTPGEAPVRETPTSPPSSSTAERNSRGTHVVQQTSSSGTKPSITHSSQTLLKSFKGDYINSPASSTRRNKPQLHYNFEWEARAIEKNKRPQAIATPPVTPQTQRLATRRRSLRVRQTLRPNRTSDLEGPATRESKGGRKLRGRSVRGASMSRNRPRGAQNRDNGLAANEEIDMWNGITRDLRKAQERNDKQRTLGLQIKALNEKIAREGNKPSLSEIDQLDSLHRQLLKLSEEEKAILQEEPTDVIRNLQILIALRSATEADPQSRAPSIPKSRKRKNDHDGSAADSPAPATSAVSDKLNRIKGSTQRSASVSSMQAREARDTVSVKIEEGTEAAKGTAAERSGQFVIGAEVVFKHNKKQHGVEGEGIQCIIKNVSGEGSKKRYDVQDPEPNENGEQGAVYKTTAASLIPIPQAGSTLPFFPPGKQVLARYPDTTTFYRAEVMGSKKDVYRLKFEGEEDDKEMDVARRFVLDIPGK